MPEPTHMHWHKQRPATHTEMLFNPGSAPVVFIPVHVSSITLLSLWSSHSQSEFLSPLELLAEDESREFQCCSSAGNTSVLMAEPEQRVMKFNVKTNMQTTVFTCCAAGILSLAKSEVKSFINLLWISMLVVSIKYLQLGSYFNHFCCYYHQLR